MSIENNVVLIILNVELTSNSKLINNGIVIISYITKNKHTKSHNIFNEPSGLKV